MTLALSVDGLRNPFRIFASSGGLLYYGLDFVEMYRQAATYSDQILRGTKPADLPVQAPNKYEMVINLKTAKALGLTVPPALLTSADEVIE
jgi:putative tryptophan/tyrosine transport system substrate-binding protein